MHLLNISSTKLYQLAQDLQKKSMIISGSKRWPVLSSAQANANIQTQNEKFFAAFLRTLNCAL